MSLLLDRTAIQGNNLKITANLKIDSEQLGGQTSSTASNHKGFKPKTLTVSLQIPYKTPQYLTSLMQLAQAVEKGGKRKVYRVVNQTAEAFGIKQCQFNENFSARQDDTLKQWQIQFNLTEYISTPERVEKRQTGSSSTEQKTPGVSSEEDTEKAPELTMWERFLKTIDDKLGGK